LFRRSKSDQSTSAATAEQLAKPGGKGRPTPSRKEAEAARKARAKGAGNKREASKLLRQRRQEQNAKVRAGMKAGDERYLPARDQGPVRSFLRDRVDARLSMAEFLLPLLVVIMLLTYSNNPVLNRSGQSLWMVTIVLVTLDTMLLYLKVKRDLRSRFPDESHKGAAFYAILRSMQLRFLRLPKPKVKLGAKI
jgi:TRAP-type uncharacterized transport system fused permease subunit